MKKIYSYSFAAAAALMLFSACNKDDVQNPVQDPEEVNPVSELVTISVNMPDEGLTKVTLTQDDENKRVIKLAWEDGDELDINGETFTVKTGTISIDGKSAEFEGTAPTPDGSGKYTISYTKLPGGYAEQTQDADGDAGHLGYAVSISGASAYTGITFSEDGADAVGGTFSQSSVLRLRALLPDAVASTVQKVIFKASKDVFAGSNTIAVNLTAPGTAGDDKTLDVYATLPAGDAITAAAMDLLIQFQTSANDYDKYTAYRQIPASTNFGEPQYIGIDCSNIDKYAGKEDDGTAAHPYLIGDQHQMQAISLSTTKQYYKLVDDIDMTGVTWTSLNADGTNIIDLDGNSKKISNMQMPLFDDLNGNVHDLTLYNSVVSSAETVGILANTCNTAASTVTRVTVTGDESPKVSSLTSTAAEATKYVGGLVGEVSTLSTFDGCHIINTTITETTTGCTYTGGAFGYIHHDSSNTGKFRYNTVETCVIKSSFNVGGLVGYFSRGNVHHNKVGYDSDGNQKKCMITGIGDDNTGDNKGGLIGYHRYGFVTSNDVYSDIKGAKYVGGLIGYSWQSIEDNSTAGAVTASSPYIGGLVGNSKGNITSCSSSSAVSTSSTDTYCWAGGLVGNAEGGTISKCSATGNINSSNNKAGMGGLLARIAGNVTIESCYATGDVAKGDGNYTLRGGLVGQIASGTVSISNSYSTGEIQAQRWSGGLIGDATSSSITVTNCYTSSVLTFTGPASAGVFVGRANKNTISYSGIIAWNTSGLTNFIYDNTVTEVPSGNYFGKDGTINSQATALGWGEIVDDESNPVWDLTWDDNRPHLAWEVKP